MIIATEMYLVNLKHREIIDKILNKYKNSSIEISKYCITCTKYLHHKCEGMSYFSMTPKCYSAKAE